jgi:hypothetical protein
VRARWCLITLKVDRRGQSKTSSEHLFLDEKNQTLNGPNFGPYKTGDGYTIKSIPDP